MAVVVRRRRTGMSCTGDATTTTAAVVRLAAAARIHDASLLTKGRNRIRRPKNAILITPVGVLV